jgi:NADH-quinone oxidoreductase subunit J
MPFEQIVFIIIGALATLAALGLVILKDPVHCALMLVLCFFNMAGTYILLGAEFMAAVQVMVYGGAIMVLFLFVMMLLQIRPGPSLNPLRFFQTRLGPVIAVAFLAEIILVIFTTAFTINGGKVTDPNNTQMANMHRNIRTAVEGAVPLRYTDNSGNPITVGTWASPPSVKLNNSGPIGHTAQFGVELYTTYLFPFIIASVVLLVAAIGAIVIAGRNLGTMEDIPEGITLAGLPLGSAQALEVQKFTKRREDARERTVIKK